MLSLQALFTSPEPDDPQDGMVARQYKEKRELYNLTASYWTYIFAIEQKTPAASNKFADFESKFCFKAMFPFCNIHTYLHYQFCFTDKISQVMNRIKCERTAALSALACNDWDIEVAIHILEWTKFTCELGLR